MTEQYYRIHCNGGSHYTVSVRGSNVKVFSTENGDELYRFVAQRVFIGKSPLNDYTQESGVHGEEYDGNTILLKMYNLNYLAILARRIIRFRSLAEIVKYVSPIYGTDVPYPYAVDTLGNYYMLIDNVVIAPGKIPRDTVEPYFWYFKDKELLKNDRTIKKFYMEGDNYNLNYHPSPDKNYDRLVYMFGPNITYEAVDGTIKHFSKEEYVSFNNQKGSVKGYSPIDITEVIRQDND